MKISEFVEIADKDKIYYMASPYSHKEKVIQAYNGDKVSRFSAYLMSLGFNIFSPIAYGEKMLEYYNLPTDAEYWWTINKALLEIADILIVYKMDGWMESKGVERELNYSMIRGMEKIFLEVGEI